MTNADFVRWGRTSLDAPERDELLHALSSSQRHCLRENDWVWLERSGVLWTTPDGSFRRARFTHSASFETARGSFRIDSEGRVSEAPPLATPPPPGA
jgi:hypothetical protein